MRTLVIENRDDLRVGDEATFGYKGNTFSGTVWEDLGTLFVGSVWVRICAGEWNTMFTFISATRDAQALPTEPGSVIQVKQVWGVKRDEWVTALLDADGDWVMTKRFDGRMFASADGIEVWRPAQVVPE